MSDRKFTEEIQLLVTEFNIIEIVFDLLAKKQLFMPTVYLSTKYNKDEMLMYHLIVNNLLEEDHIKRLF
jgi:hypothetical protein